MDRGAGKNFFDIPAEIQNFVMVWVGQKVEFTCKEAHVVKTGLLLEGAVYENRHTVASEQVYGRGEQLQQLTEQALVMSNEFVER